MADIIGKLIEKSLHNKQILKGGKDCNNKKNKVTGVNNSQQTPNAKEQKFVRTPK